MQQFTMASGLAQPVVNTDAASNIQATSAQLNAIVNPSGTVDAIHLIGEPLQLLAIVFRPLRAHIGQ